MMSEDAYVIRTFESRSSFILSRSLHVEKNIVIYWYSQFTSHYSCNTCYKRVLRDGSKTGSRPRVLVARQSSYLETMLDRRYF